jgi:hypothetical protein
MIKSRKMKLAEHVARMGNIRYARRSLIEILERRRPGRGDDIKIDNWRSWIGLFWLRIQNNVGHL